MLTFSAVRGERGWVVERIEPSGSKVVIGHEFATKYEAELEANKFSKEAAQRIVS